LRIKDVPLGEALDLVLQKSGLRYRFRPPGFIYITTQQRFEFAQKLQTLRKESLNETLSTDGKRYLSSRVTLLARSSPIKEVIVTLRKSTGAPITFDVADTIADKMFVSLHADQTLADALDWLVAQTQLYYAYQSGIIHIASPEQIQANRKSSK